MPDSSSERKLTPAVDHETPFFGGFEVFRRINIWIHNDGEPDATLERTFPQYGTRNKMNVLDSLLVELDSSTFFVELID